MDKIRADKERRQLYLDMACINLLSPHMSCKEAEDLLLKYGWGDLSTERQLEILVEVNKEAKHGN